MPKIARVPASTDSSKGGAWEFFGELALEGLADLELFWVVALVAVGAVVAYGIWVTVMKEMK